MRRLVFGILGLVLSSSLAHAQPIPADLKKAVVFVFIRTAQGLVPNGTAFWLGVPLEGAPDQSALYLVTARHVLIDSKTKTWFPEVVLRANKKDGSVFEATVALKASSDGQNVFTHPTDTSVDLAVLPAAINLEILDVRFVPLSMATDKNDIPRLGIAEGSKVLFIGLFSRYYGSAHNYPIVRFGHVSLLTNEPITFQDVPEHLYLFEVASFGGNSGSPAFFSLGPESHPHILTPSPPQLFLAGVVKGTYLDLQEIRSISTAETPFSRSSMGIAAVVPSYQLREIVLSEPLLSKRRALRP